ncbi:MAG TPA: HipA family kinase [Verrucomicrobiae bacterium]|nr:HipA family kinase [Verrucomicrobiae bacterium]
MDTTCVFAVQHLRRMRGGAQSHLLQASDGAHYVTKFMNNPQHVRVLANEMLATNLGLRLGLPMPRVEVINVSDRLIEDTDDLRVKLGRASIPCSCGRQLASLYVGDTVETVICDYLPDAVMEDVVNIQDFARVLVLDKWTCNSDGRQAVFKLEASPSRRYTAVFIDQGFCFNGGEWNFPDAPLRGAYARQRVYENVKAWESFEPALTRAEQMDLEELWRYAAQVPQEWYEYDVSGLNRLVETLYRRRLRIRDLISDFRKSNRNPFPNWVER